jgi:hypothetical protein
MAAAIAAMAVIQEARSKKQEARRNTAIRDPSVCLLVLSPISNMYNESI